MYLKGLGVVLGKLFRNTWCECDHDMSRLRKAEIHGFILLIQLDLRDFFKFRLDLQSGKCKERSTLWCGNAIWLFHINEILPVLVVRWLRSTDHHSVHLSLSIGLVLCLLLSVWLSFTSSLCLPRFWSIYFVFRRHCLDLSRYLYLYIFLSLRLSVCLSVSAYLRSALLFLLRANLFLVVVVACKCYCGPIGDRFLILWSSKTSSVWLMRFINRSHVVGTTYSIS